MISIGDSQTKELMKQLVELLFKVKKFVFVPFIASESNFFWNKIITFINGKSKMAISLPRSF